MADASAGPTFTPPRSAAEPEDSAAAAGRRAWRAAVGLALGLCVARVAYLFFFSTWELVADEAHYWEWSRRPDWSYYTKGPGVAWAIWLSVHLFGHSAGAVRMPSALAACLMTLAGAALARDLTGGRGRAPWYAAVALSLAPGFFATAQLLTTDSFYAAGWMIASWLTFRAVRPGATRRARLLAWTAVGATLGVACLFKYTALFFLVGLAALFVVDRRRTRLDRTALLGLACALVALVACASPILIWNHAHGWPTIAHQLGRLRIPGGDERVAWDWSPMWFVSFALAQIGLLGGAGAVAIWLAVRRPAEGLDEGRVTGTRLMLCCAAPIVGFYLLLSVARQTQGNWALAGYTTLLVLVAAGVADATARPDPASRPLIDAWRWFVGIGIGAAVVILLGPTITRLPGLRSIPGVQKVERRVNGARERAAAIDAVRARLAGEAGRAPLVVASRYQEASLLAFYLPHAPAAGHATTYAATALLGGRPTAYDFFADTDLRDPALLGRDALLLGATRDRWRAALAFESVEPEGTLPNVFIARGYDGVRPAAARPPLHALAPR